MGARYVRSWISYGLKDTDPPPPRETLFKTVRVSVGNIVLWEILFKAVAPPLACTMRICTKYCFIIPQNIIKIITIWGYGGRYISLGDVVL